MNLEQEEWIRDQLKKQREAVLQDLDRQRGADRQSSDEGLDDPVDRTERELERALEHRRENDDGHLLQKINRALTRLDEGDYEVCENCQGIIPWERLQAKPSVSLCLPCQQRKEDGKTVEEPR